MTSIRTLSRATFVVYRPAACVLGVVAMMAVGASSLQGQCAPRPHDLISCRGSLIRTYRDTTADTSWTPGFGTQPIYPWADATWNSRIPDSRNDGALWAGRGLSSSLSGGLELRYGRLRLAIAPQIIYTENRPTFVISPRDSLGLSTFANPWHTGFYRIDLPIRMGAAALREINPGQSRLEVRSQWLSGGFSTEDQWWGPGERNALIMSNNAGGIPHIFLRTTGPVSLPVGIFEGRAILGVLTESRFFDTTSANDLRSLSAAVVTWRPWIDTSLVIGVARSSYARLAGISGLGSHILDFLLPLPAQDRDELESAFARWELSDELEIHAEVAHLRMPSLRTLLVDPQHTQGYTVGLRWLGDSSTRGLRVGADFEATMLEQQVPTDRSDVLGYYISARVPQGYTQRGQLIGAGIGPGGSSQWGYLYGVVHGLTAGLVAERVRWDNEAYYRQPTGVTYTSHDVSLSTGVRGGFESNQFSIRLELMNTHRWNYLFQTANVYDWNPAFDIGNKRLSVSFGYRP